jgi:hypothetical protein
MKNDFGFIVIKETDYSKKRHENLLEAMEEASRLTKKELKSFYVLAPVKKIQLSIPPLEICTIE